jgi:hypothetical protein
LGGGDRRKEAKERQKGMSGKTTNNQSLNPWPPEEDINTCMHLCHASHLEVIKNLNLYKIAVIAQKINIFEKIIPSKRKTNKS